MNQDVREQIIRDGGKGFIQALDTNRYDQTTRLVFADWLEEMGHDDEALEQRRRATDRWVASDKWLREYAATKAKTYEKPDEAFENLLADLKRREVFYHGNNLHGFYELEDPDELKEHADWYLGIEIDWGRFEFSCSC